MIKPLFTKKREYKSSYERLKVPPHAYTRKKIKYETHANKKNNNNNYENRYSISTTSSKKNIKLNKNISYNSYNMYAKRLIM